MSAINTRHIMANAKFYESYSRYIDEKRRYETWDESVERVMQMHREFYKDKMTPELAKLLDFVERSYKDKDFLGAQRALQFGGKQLLQHHARLYNCSATYCDRSEVFGEIMYLMLCGAGVGFSVQYRHVEKLPKVTKRVKTAKSFVVPDSIEGWSQAVDILLSSFFVGGGRYPEYEGRKVYFDLSKIRKKGAYISGGFKAPGPEPLRLALDKIEHLLVEILEKNDNQPTKLKPIEIYDIVMYIADAVISGGVRRAATICLFSKEDVEMRNAKTGDWFITNPQRSRSNNSVVLLRNEVTFEEFQEIMDSVKSFGEPGFIFTDNLDNLFNPCVEIAMQGYTEDGKSGFQMCNLTEVNGGKSTSKEKFFEQCKAAAIMGTLQAGYTDFKYLTENTKKIVEREALIGVSITGWMNNPDILFDKETMKEGARVVKEWNKKVAKMIGINQAARTTCVKPSGNASTLLETASGIHGEHSPIYIRHAQFNKETEIAKLFMKKNPDMCEESVYNPADIVVGFPVISPPKSIYKKDLLGVKQLEYVKLAQNYWIEEGTNIDLCVDKTLRHNVSNTITVDDWEEVTNYIFKNKNSFCGISLMAASGDKSYPQAPFTEVLTEEEILKIYGKEAFFTSALIENALSAYNNNLWNAVNTALGFGEQLTEKHEDHLKREFVRRFEKFSKSFEPKIIDETLKNSIRDFLRNLNNEIENKIDELNIHRKIVRHLLKVTFKYNDPIITVNNLYEAFEKDLENLLLVRIDKKSKYYSDNLFEFEVFLREKLKNLDMVYEPIVRKGKEKCGDCLKDIYNLHKMWRIVNNFKEIDFLRDLPKKEFVDIDTMAGQACSGGQCDISF